MSSGALRRGRRAGALVALVTLGLLASAGASVVLRLSDADLAQRAALILRGRVEGVRSEWLPGGRRIVTRVDLRVTEVLKRAETAPEVGQTFELYTPGGAVGDLGQTVPGAAQFELDEDVVVYLESTASGFTPVGLALGKFRVVAGDDGVLRALRDLDGLGFATVPGTQGDPSPADPRTEQDLSTLLDPLRGKP